MVRTSKTRKSSSFWVQNLTGYNVGLGDLACKVPAKKTVDLYSLAPYITPNLVNSSQETGELKTMIAKGYLKIVSGPSKEKARVKTAESKPSLPSRVQERDKGCVVINNNDLVDEFEEDDVDSLDAFDTSLDNEGANHRSPIKQLDNGSIVVSEQKDETLNTLRRYIDKVKGLGTKEGKNNEDKKQLKYKKTKESS